MRLLPKSLVLNLILQSATYTQFLIGRHLHALFLTLISSVDKTLGDRLHESTSDKAFTVSSFQVQFNHARRNKLSDWTLQ